MRPKTLSRASRSFFFVKASRFFYFSLIFSVHFSQYVFILLKNNNKISLLHDRSTRGFECVAESRFVGWLGCVLFRNFRYRKLIIFSSYKGRISSENPYWLSEKSNEQQKKNEKIVERKKKPVHRSQKYVEREAMSERERERARSNKRACAGKRMRKRAHRDLRNIYCYYYYHFNDSLDEMNARYMRPQHTHTHQEQANNNTNSIGSHITSTAK